jgi:hypothetical protein
MKTILVTGTSTGIGFATAVSLMRAGHDPTESGAGPGVSRGLTFDRIGITLTGRSKNAHHQ